MSEADDLPPLVVPSSGDVPTDTVDVRTGPDVDPGLLLLLPLLGVWRGRGKGDLGAGEFDFGQEMRFSHDGRALMAYESVAWTVDADGSAGSGRPPVVRERGFWRPRPRDGRDAVEAVIAHDDGTVEVSLGHAVGTRFELASDVVLRTGGEGLRIHRLFGLVQGDLMYAWDRAAAGGALRPAMSARLRRVSAM